MLKLTRDKHEASRGLSASATDELLVNATTGDTWRLVYRTLLTAIENGVKKTVNNNDFSMTMHYQSSTLDVQLSNYKHR